MIRDELSVLAGALIPVVAVRARIVGGEERTDDELSAPKGCHAAADLLDDAAVLVPHRGGRWKD